ncbi:MAG: aldo/keto reductase [Gammaproteobacteria bacterium]
MIKYRQLGNSSLSVSEIGLGTMNFGTTVDEGLASKIVSFALERGINLIDTAETYPYPPSAATHGLSETILGNCLKSSGRRDQLVVVSKIAGPSSHLEYLRDGRLMFDRRNVSTWINETLIRLQTDYLDIALLHWPMRATNTLGQLDYKPARKEADSQAIVDSIEQSLFVLNEQIAAGKIRYLGLSNETPWGVMRYLQVAERLGHPRIVTLQNRYNLVDRSFDIGLAEIVDRESIGFMAYSPLAFGLLSKKSHLAPGQSKNSRLMITKKLHRYLSKNCRHAAQQYLSLAQDHEVDFAQMAIAYLLSRRYVTSVLVGATNLEQLSDNLAATENELEKNLLTAINKIHRQHPNPGL